MTDTQFGKFKARMMVKVPDIVVISVLKKIKQGAPMEDVERDFMVPEPTIRGWCKRAGIQLPRKTRDWESIKLALGIT